MDMGFKRLLLIILSIAGGIAGLFLTMLLLNFAYGAGVTLESYGPAYAVLTALPIALLVGLWLDYFMGTGLLRTDDVE